MAIEKKMTIVSQINESDIMKALENYTDQELAVFAMKLGKYRDGTYEIELIKMTYHILNDILSEQELAVLLEELKYK